MTTWALIYTVGYILFGVLSFTSLIVAFGDDTTDVVEYVTMFIMSVFWLPVIIMYSLIQAAKYACILMEFLFQGVLKYVKFVRKIVEMCK